MSPQPDFHADEADRVEGERHAGIVVKNGKILLIHRIRAGREYYVLPGGHRRETESGEEGLIREVYEETAVRVSHPKLVLTQTNDYGHVESNYICTWVNGDQPELIGEEKLKNSPEDFYEPLWVKVEEVASLNILPEYIKSWLTKHKLRLT